MTDDPPAGMIEAVVAEAERAGLAPGFAEKVAANALGIAQRDRVQGADAAARARVRLRQILGADGSESELTAALCTAIRGGALVLENDGLIDHLIQATLDKIAIDQPAYPAFVALKAGGG